MLTDVTPLVSRLYTGPGVYSFDFLLYDTDNMEITHVDTNGIPTQLPTTDFTATTLAPEVGGSVTVASTAYGTTGTLYIKRKLFLEQNVDWVNSDDMDMELLEKSQDRIVMMIQQINASFDDVLSISNWKGLWASGARYVIRDLVSLENGNWYLCQIAHTAGATFAADLALGYWILALDVDTVTQIKDLAVAAQAAAEEALASTIETRQIVEEARDITIANEQSCAIAEANTAENAQNTANCAASAYENAQIALGVASDFVPVGAIIAFKGGYFTNASNGGFTNVIGNDATTINTRINTSGWYVCNGAACNVTGSPVYEGTGRYLANLTDNRYIQGSSSAGAIGGNNTMEHYHGMQHDHDIYHLHAIPHTHTIVHTHTTGSLTLTTAQIPSHTHGYNSTDGVASIYESGDFYGHYGFTSSSAKSTTAAGSGSSHNHGATGGSSAANSGSSSAANSAGPSVVDSGVASTPNTGAATYAENRPRFLSCWYIEKVI
jgi:hypothetical protein